MCTGNSHSKLFSNYKNIKFWGFRLFFYSVLVAEEPRDWAGIQTSVLYCIILTQRM